MKRIIFCIAMIIMPLYASAQNIVKLKIEGVEKEGGKIYLSIFNNESTYKEREAFLSLILHSDNIIVTREIKLPLGQYLFSIYQDGNDNGKLDTNLLGIPREKFGFSNYDGKSAPGNFNRHKVLLNEYSKDVVITLHKI